MLVSTLEDPETYLHIYTGHNLKLSTFFFHFAVFVCVLLLPLELCGQPYEIIHSSEMFLIYGLRLHKAPASQRLSSKGEGGRAVGGGGDGGGEGKQC